MGFDRLDIQLLRKEEEKKHSKMLYRPPIPVCNITVKPLKNGKVVYIIKEGKEMNQSNSQ